MSARHEVIYFLKSDKLFPSKHLMEILSYNLIIYVSKYISTDFLKLTSITFSLFKI